jgi:hypothetical protein
VAENSEPDIKPDSEQDTAEERRRMEVTLQSTSLVREALQKALDLEKAQHLATATILAGTRVLLGEATKLHTKGTARADAAEAQAKELGEIRHALEKRDIELDNLTNQLVTAKDSLDTQHEELATAKRDARMVRG